MERLTDSKRLEKDVQIDIHKRPIKIAFFISDEENENNHLILDEIFKYSYTCWGGARFLILPLNSDEESYLEYNHYTIKECINRRAKCCKLRKGSSIVLCCK